MESSGLTLRIDYFNMTKDIPSCEGMFLSEQISDEIFTLRCEYIYKLTFLKTYK